MALGVCFCTGRWFPFFITKNSQVGFFNNTPIFFSFFVGFGSSRGAWAGIGCVWAHPLFRSRENLCQRSNFISNSLLCTVQDRSASAASETGEGEGEKLNQVGQVLLAPEPPSSALSLSLSLSHPPLIPGGMWNPPHAQVSSDVRKVAAGPSPHGRGTRAPGRSQRSERVLCIKHS